MKCAECGSKNIENTVILDTNFYIGNHKPCFVPIKRCKDCGFSFWDDLFGNIASQIIIENEKGNNMAGEDNPNLVGGIKKESGERREFNTGAKKQSSTGKGTPVLFPPDAYLEISQHFEDGAAIYGGRNWEKGIPLSELINSLERHIAQFKMGLTDENHLRAIAWNAVVLLATKVRIEAIILPKELDDINGVYSEK